MSRTISQYDIFFSYNWRDRAAVEAVARILREEGLKVFLDQWYLVPGHSWLKTLEEALMNCQAVSVFLGPHGMGGWQQRETDLALNRQTRDSAFQVVPVLLPGADPALGFLSLYTWVDMRAGTNDAAAVDMLAAAVRGQAVGPELQAQMNATLATICPYRGLRAFREEDAPLFFGREAFTARLAEAIAQHTMVAVVGASGYGKSSVVRAGLVPHLRKRVNEQVWDIATMVPGDRPLHALASALMPGLEPEMTETARLAEIGNLAGHIEEKNVPLRDVVARILEKQPGTDHLLLVVDQWEELYTLVQGDQIRQRFIDELLEASKEGALTVVLTLRGDFFGHVLSHRALADRLQNAIVNLGPMTRDELKDAIEAPAQKVGLSFEPGLVGRILDEVEEEPGSLPLLEFVLTGLWERRHAGRLLHDAYEDMGKVKGAMARRADKVYGKLSPAEQKLVRRVLVQLVRPGEGTEDTRRRATLTELGEAARPVVRQLASARLTVTGRDEARGEQTVEVAHEALIHNWARLRGWLNEDREFLLWRQRLRSHLDEWEHTGREKGALLHGAPLTEAERWLDKRADDVGTAERKFLACSRRRKTDTRSIAAICVILALGLGIYTIIITVEKAYQKKVDREVWFAENAYPKELYEYQHQLETLHLRDRVNLNRLPWLLSDSIRNLKLHARGSNIGGISRLADCDSLETLTLHLSPSEATDLEPLEKLSQLSQLTLKLGGTAVSDLQPVLKKLTGLTQLTLDLSPLDGTALHPLAELTGLTHLSLDLSYYNSKSNFQPLESLESLTHLSLDLSGSQLNDLSQLTKLSGLTHLALNLCDSRVTDLSPLTRLNKEFKELTLETSPSKVSDLLRLQQLERLTRLTLDLHDSDVIDLSPLEKLSGLTQLTLVVSLRNVSNLKIPKSLSGPTRLTLIHHANGVRDLSQLVNLREVTQLTLDLINTKVNDLSPLKSLNSLTSLILETFEGDTDGVRTQLREIPESVSHLEL